MCHLSDNALEQLMMRPTEFFDDRVLSIYQKIQKAQGLFEIYGNALLNDPHISALLSEMKVNLKNSYQAMIDFGIVNACKHCDEKEGGSCCAAGMENKLDPILLFTNLLLGITLPDEHTRNDGCFFLSKKGCILKARLFLCVDFLCPNIKNNMTLDDLIKLQTISGEELETSFKLENAIKQSIQILSKT